MGQTNQVHFIHSAICSAIPSSTSVLINSLFAKLFLSWNMLEHLNEREHIIDEPIIMLQK